MIESSEIHNQDEGSWVNMQGSVAVETPAFNTKIYDLPP
jgi:hypothetical protein